MKKLLFLFIVCFNVTLWLSPGNTIFYNKDKPLIVFSNLNGMWIDFDTKNNKWIYKGNLKEMEIEVHKSLGHTVDTLSLVIIEIIRQLKNKEGNHGNVDNGTKY